MDDPAQRTAMGIKARNTVLAHYRVQHEAEGIQAVYEKIFSRHSRV